MSYSQTTPASLAEGVVSNLSKEVTYAYISTDGAQRIAQLIEQLFKFGILSNLQTLHGVR